MYASWIINPNPNPNSNPTTAHQQLLFNKLLFMKQFTKCFYSKRLFHMSSLEATSTWSSEACTNIAQIAEYSVQTTECRVHCSQNSVTGISHIAMSLQRYKIAMNMSTCTSIGRKKGRATLAFSKMPTNVYNFIEQLIKCGKTFCQSQPHPKNRDRDRDRDRTQT